MKKRGIFHRFIKNYVFMFFISTLIVMVPYILLTMTDYFLNNDEPINMYSAESIMMDDYNKINVKNIIEKHGGVQVVKENLQVINLGGTKGIEKEKLTKEEWSKFLINSEREDSDNSYSIKYNEKEKFWLIVTFPTSFNLKISVVFNSKANGYNKMMGLIFGIFLVYIGVLMLSTFLYSKISARDFIEPIKKLCSDTEKLKNGDYSYSTYEFKIDEFEQLKNDMHSLASQLEREKKLRNELEENRKNLIMDISHDLKNPLASAMGCAESLLNDESKYDEKTLRYLRVIYNNSTRANELITDLFEYSKLESSSIIFNKEKTDICEFIREEICTYIPLFEENNMKFDFDNICDEEIIINMDVKLMKRVMYNLFTNAVKYNPEGTKIEASLTHDGNFAVLKICDNGVGISDEFKNNIFEPFVRCDKVRNSKSGGSGLGLAIVKKIIEGHDGTITLFSEENKYSKFIINIPVCSM